jgi:uncharacterized membrane protein YkvA (DUF1232 family)
MAFRITIELSERDLRHFRRELDKARAAVRIADDEEIVSAARELAASLKATRLPDFVTARFGRLEAMLEMVTDADWKLREKDRGPVLAALAYLCDPEDLIPDDIPGIGLLDDAVMIELVFHELRHEIEAYEDFVRFRKSLARGTLKRDEAATCRALERRRVQLVERMQRRRLKDRRGRR